VLVPADFVGEQYILFFSRAIYCVQAGISCRPFAVVPADFVGEQFFCRAMYCVEAGIHRFFF
jgi:hypothetical protein